MLIILGKRVLDFSKYQKTKRSTNYSNLAKVKTHFAPKAFLSHSL